MDQVPAQPRPRWRRPAALAATVAALVAAAGGGLLVSTGSSAATKDAQLTSSGGFAPTGAAGGSKVTVTGTGTVQGTPDTLDLQMGASTTASTATGALDQNNSEVAALSAVFVAHGVKGADIQTSGLSLSPNYDSNGDVSGYQASDELTITMTMHDLTRAGGVIDAAAHAVGNDVEIDGISFSIADTSSLLQAARIDAVRNAQTKAEAFARAAGAKLGPVMTITDQEQQTPPVVQYSFAARAAGASSTPVPVHAGSQQLSVQVQVVYALRG